MCKLLFALSGNLVAFSFAGDALYGPSPSPLPAGERDEGEGLVFDSILVDPRHPLPYRTQHFIGDGVDFLCDLLGSDLLSSLLSYQYHLVSH
jgi:hypothetical protein